MAPNSYFNDYVEILSQALKKVRKIGFKKFNAMKDLLDTTQSFLSKQVYGRIQPSNYLLCLILLFGAKNPKLYPILIQTIQKLFSHNFISHNQCLSQSLRLLNQNHKQFLILPYEDYQKKIFKQIYIETLALLPEKDDTINLMIVKNYSLIWRLSQSSLSVTTIGKIFQFIIESIIENKIQENIQTLKSAFLQIVRHSFQSYKQCLDYKLITDENNISVKSICYNYGKVLFDQVAIKSFVQKQHHVKQYSVIPDPQKFRDFKLYVNKQVNEIQQMSGKFGWCINCRKPANYYCKLNRVPVCSFNCKNQSYNEFQMVDKLVSDQLRSANIFQNHVKRICRLFVRYLSGKDAKKTTCFSQIFVFVSTQLKKWNFTKISQNTLRQLRWVFRQTITNIQIQHQAFIGSILSMKKMLFLRTFKQQTQILLKILAKKLTHFLTSPKIKQQILKVIRQLVQSNLLFDYAYIFDCQDDCNDVVKDLIQALSKIYIGINVPQGLIVPPQEGFIKKSVYELLVFLFEQLKKCPRIMPKQQQVKLYQKKQKKNQLKYAIQRFNKSQKPYKVIKALISQKFLKKDPLQIAQFLHNNISKLSFSNIGVLIGGYDEAEIKIRDQFIKLINFNSLMIDEGIRKLLKHFTIPGESQVVQRIIDSFSKIFYEQNRQDNIFHHSDAVFSLSYLLMMLQTNLHNPQVIQKMTLAQFANLSKGMNGPNDFKQDFLQKTYKSIQKTQLGFHEKMRQMQIIIAYKQSPRLAIPLHTKQLQRQIKQYYQDLGTQNITFETISANIHYPLKIYSHQYLQFILDVLTQKIQQTQDKQQILKDLDIMENILKFSLENQTYFNIQKGIKNVWDQITKTNTMKKYIFMEKLLDWIDLFDQYLLDQWNIVIYLFSKFYRNKLIKKQFPSSSKKDDKMVIMGDKCYLYEPFINNLWSRSSKYTVQNFKCLIQALIEINKQQITENAHPFCLQKIGQIQQYNMNRAIDIFPVLWPILKDYYIELGKNKDEKTALFGTDFLKQLITKFLKKKDLINYQKQYMKPLEQIFSSSKLFAVKQYIIGSLAYFINNHSTNMKAGWKIILPIICQAFEEEEDQIIKDKAFSNIRKIYESKFSLFNLEENYVDFVQILSRLPHQKNQAYPKGCIEAIRAIIQYYHVKYDINLQNIEAESNKNLDTAFWQTYFLPLLSTIYVICGDSRSQVQIMAIQLLFSILMKYGKLFKYQFWKMVLQGVLRPTFQQITYAFQSKSIKKQQHQNWLRLSFQKLFSSINCLIEEYIQDFRLFLYDVLKIYQTCILSYSNKILIQLSVSSLGELFNKVGDKFQVVEWEEFLRFTQSILKKSIPNQLFSQQNWQRQKQMPQKSYQGKSIAMSLFSIKIQQIVENYSVKIGINIIRQIVDQLKSVKSQLNTFNQNIQLRKKLWQDGFYTNMKSLPGLQNQQYELQKCILTIQFESSKINQSQYLQSYLKTFNDIILSYNKRILFNQQKQQSSLLRKQTYRESVMDRLLILSQLRKRIVTIPIQKIDQYKYKNVLFESFLSILSRKSFCPNCQFCQNCQINLQQQEQFSSQIKKYVQKLFYSNSNN